MKVRKSYIAILGLCMLGLVLSGCFGLGTKVGEVRGVVTYDDGSPVADAQVKLGEATTTTDDKGAFIVRNLAYKTYPLSVSIEGAVRYTGQVVVNEMTKTVSVEIPLLRGTVTGKVTWDDDTPIANAEVRLGDATARTDEEGTYGFDAVIYGNYDVGVYIDDGPVYIGTVVVDAENVANDIVVPASLEYAAVNGFVGLVDATPLPGAVVSFGSHSATANSDGNFEFVDVLFGTYRVTVSIDGNTIHSEDVTIDEKTMDLTLVVERATVAGTVAYEDGVAIPGATISLGDLTTEADSDATFGFELVPYGTYSYTITVDGDVKDEGQVVIDQPAVTWDVVVPRPPLVVYNKQVGGTKWHIFKAYADGSEEVQLTEGNAENWYPRLSPDGTRIVFESWRDGNRNLYIMNVDGTDVQRITSVQTEDRHAAWSPDGEWLLFHSNGGGHSNYELYKIRPDGTELQRLTSGGGNNTWPSWSPDGEKVVFSSNRGGNYELYVMNADGTDARALTDNGNTNRNAAWSPDGSTVAFGSGRTDDGYEICVIDVDSLRTECLTNNTHYDGYPYWSQDGAQILYTTIHNGLKSLYVMDADGGNARLFLADDVNIEYAAW